MPPENQSEHSLSSQNSLDGAKFSSVIEKDIIQVDDKLYSASAIASIHPGGDFFVKAFAGRDATEAFISYHRRSFPHSKMANALVGQSNKSKPDEYMKDYLELCSLVEKVLPRAKSFAPTRYYIKISVMFAVAIWLELYIHISRRYVWFLVGPLSFLFSLMHLNIQHDANHGAISKTPYINRFLGWTLNWVGGSSIDWIHQHVVQHHLVVGDIYKDPEFKGYPPYLRLNPTQSIKPFNKYQHYYMILLFPYFAFRRVINPVLNTYNGKNKTPMSSMITKERKVDVAVSCLFYLRWFIIPFILSPTLTTILGLLSLFIVNGVFLTIVVFMSHNFMGVQIFDSTKPSPRKSFLYEQVVSSANFGGAWFCEFTGGRNFHIEHHLFPRVCHSHLSVVAPIVKEYCRMRNIPYTHFPTLYDHLKSMFQHIGKMGGVSE